jgi:hypothetical protein
VYVEGESARIGRIALPIPLVARDSGIDAVAGAVLTRGAND